MKRRSALVIAVILLTSCAAPQTEPRYPAQPTAQAEPTPASTPSGKPNSTLTEAQAATLSSLRLVDDHPLYTMHYVGSYREQADLGEGSHALRTPQRALPASCQLAWGCSLFAALGDEDNRLFGRNFDWQFSPALLLFSAPADGYASVSMVDIEYLGFGGDRSRNLEQLSLEELRPLLQAPFLPFDGMNEQGLAVGMAAVPEEEMPRDPQKPTIDHLEVIREVLDHAGTVGEAIDIFGSYNIDMGNVPLHYLIASTLGDSALVEFRDGELVVFRNESSWQEATNFLVSSTNGHPQGKCWRYDRLSQRLEESEGRISSQDAFGLLEEVSQDNTQWTILYHMTRGELQVVMGRDYSGTQHTFDVTR